MEEPTPQPADSLLKPKQKRNISEEQRSACAARMKAINEKRLENKKKKLESALEEKPVAPPTPEPVIPTPVMQSEPAPKTKASKPPKEPKEPKEPVKKSPKEPKKRIIKVIELSESETDGESSEEEQIVAVRKSKPKSKYTAPSPPPPPPQIEIPKRAFKFF